MNEAAANGWPISMTARFPALPSRPPDDLLRGAVSLTNELDVRLVGTGAAQPDLALVRDGRVVALPVGLRLVALTLDLPPGGTQDLEASASLRSCEAGPYPAGTPLSSGPYQVFAAYQVDITPPSEDPGTLVVRGGPWPIFLP